MQFQSIQLNNAGGENRMLDIAKSNGIVAVQLKKVIVQKGLKQTSIATKAGFSAQEINDMLNGRRIMRVADIESILNVVKELGIDANYLFGMEKKKIRTIEKISTKELIEELKKRQGVTTEYAEPYQDKTVSVNGPAIILTVCD